MDQSTQPIDDLLVSLKERAKELNCLYEVEELFGKPGISLEDIFRGIVHAIPPGWQFVDVCHARIVYGGFMVETPGFRETPWMQVADIEVQDDVAGQIVVCYTEELPAADEGPFLKEERRLINTIAERLGRRILHERLRIVFEDQAVRRPQEAEWQVILDLLKRTDPRLLTRLGRKMLNHLSWAGVVEADRILGNFIPSSRGGTDSHISDENRPMLATALHELHSMTDEIYALAGKHMPEQEILAKTRKWIQEDRSRFLVKILENTASSLAEVAGAIERFHHLMPQGVELSFPRERGFRVSLIRRLLSADAHYINVAKRHVSVHDFYGLLHRVIAPADSHGMLGGKGAGLFLAAQILKDAAAGDDRLREIRMPKTWYLTSDGILNFISHNDLEETVEQKYQDIAQVRHEYPYIVHLFKNAALPPEIVTGLSVALDDLGETPLIVRSSSLLEDRLGTSFAGKYKSLFIANQGTKHERLTALMDAITEVYASTLGPDPIEYRSARGMVDFHEEMGVLIQEVVGTKVGDYYLPAFAGVAFTNNEFRWSRRIRREDGLLRMVPGLGTRAVDRLADDYPVLVAPGQPSLRVNVTLDEKVRYAPKKIDVINLRTNAFETIEVRDLLAKCADEYPMLRRLVSIREGDHLEQPSALGVDASADRMVVTFEGLITDTPFVEQMRTILDVLQAEFHMPVDIEFAHDGQHLYLLQCRPQSYSEAVQPASIPHDIPRDRMLFSANRYVSNGAVSSITHIVYVDPLKYGEIATKAELLAVGRAVGRLNQMLPKRQFILMGPGRWGSRGDIRLGVSVSYSDINNTAMLIEIARKQREFEPELSFGTHFFQDLVESGIRYLPLYPDDKDVVFNESLLMNAENLLPGLLPDQAELAGVIRVIDVREASGGRTLQVRMNADQNQAVGILVDAPAVPVESTPVVVAPESSEQRKDIHWRWRLGMAERLAGLLDPRRFGVKALYLFGSTKNGMAGPGSDIDLLVHCEGSQAQTKELESWLEGWSLCLSQMNYLRTGVHTDGLLDVHVITDEDIQQRTSYASRIGATTDAARLLPLGRETKSEE